MIVPAHPALKIEAHPLGFRRNRRDNAVLEITIREKEFILLVDLGRVLFRLTLSVSQTSRFRRAIGELDANESLSILWVEVTWPIVDVPNWLALPRGEFL